MPSAPLGISSQSRKNLKAFRFTAKAAPLESDKENSNVESCEGFGIVETSCDIRASSEHEHAGFEKDFPRTPTSKIPLADLIGNTEDAFNCAPKDITPDDHVYWQHGPRSSDPASSVPSSHRGTKRARSSSPASSSQNEKSLPSGQKKTVDLQSLQQFLKTPQTDPATDLWNRYADTSLASANGDNGPVPAFAHLMTSSPQTPTTTNSKDSGLRRSISCGNEWPAAKTKRRKTESGEPLGRVRDLFAQSRGDILAQEKPKVSRVSLLVEKIQESLSRKMPAGSNGPSSSSPLPEIGEIPAAPPPGIPSSGVNQHQGDCTITGVQVDQGSPLNEKGTRVVAIVDDGDSSEFADDDIDVNFLETVESAATQGIGRNADVGSNDDQVLEVNHSLKCRGNETHQSKVQRIYPHNDKTTTARNLVQLPLSHDCQSTTTGHACAQKPASSFGPEVVATEEILDGEFSEDDDGTFATGMEDLVAQYETRDANFQAPETQSSHQNHSGLDPGDQRKSQQVQINYRFDDAFDDDGDDELWDHLDDAALAVETTAPIGSTSQKNRNNRAIKRYLVLDIVQGDYENTQGRKRLEKILSVKDEKTGLLKVILLRQSWYESKCTKGSYIHLIGDFDSLNQCIVDDADNMIILHPDHLVSATVVADSFTCTRRAVLQDRVKATGAAEKAQAYGHILHEVFGEALKANNWETENLREIVEKVLSNHIETLYEINVQLSEAINYVMSKMPELRAWASIFISADPVPEGVIRDRDNDLATMSINKLLEVEEHIWSPMYGLKGNVDATIQVTMQAAADPAARRLTVPLELKTGKKDNSESHRAQTQLYTLLLSDRYDINVTCGVLYYLETSKTFRVQSMRNEIRHMIIQRNELACYVRNKLELPPMIKKTHMCKTCYAQTPCFMYHKLIEEGDSETSGLGEKFDHVVSHLKVGHQEFFKKWDDLLTKEERDSMKFRRELWTMLSSEREALGRCFGNVVIEPGSAFENPEGPRINRFQYTFIKQSPSSSFSFTESQLTIGEPIVISDEKGHFALANGYITNVLRTGITVAVDRKLHNARRKGRNFNAQNNQVFVGIMEVGTDKAPPSAELAISDEPILYRLDKDEFSNGMATARNNIIRLMERGLFRAHELRQLVIEGMAPSFKPSSSAYTLSGPASQQNLNVDQRRAIEKVMSAKDYALVLGMPGTGKTTTIAHIIRALVSQGKSVLLTSYTHTAVDNILLKIKDDNIPILRLGAVGKVHPEVQNFADLGGIPKKTIAELENSYVNSKVVATTCLGITAPIFNARIFDYCIVDEASQITLPVCLGPIRMARTFILVGDHYQLPPLVQNKEAQEGGLDISLFKMLSDAQPNSVVNLEHQYRMAEDIMTLSNELIYSGRLKCGTEAIANRVLKIPDLEGGLAAHHFNSSSILTACTPTSICLSTSSCWLRYALSPRSRCLFLNTDSLGSSARDNVSGARITNAVETTLTAHLVTTMIQSGVNPRNIGVITFYRSQLALLRQELKAVAGSVAGGEVEMHTADKFQGRDKEVVVLSCVRSNEANRIGELLKDWRRVNVAVTRAKSKLIIIGSKGTLGGSQNRVLEGLVNLMESKGWTYDLPKTALEGHAFESSGQATGRLRGGASDPVSPVRRTALQPRSSNTSLPPSQSPRKNSSFRKPTKVVHGSLDIERMLEKHPVAMDIVRGM